MQAYYIDFEPDGGRFSCTEGTTILEVARRAGIPLSSICGGRTICGRCRVRVVAGRTSPISDEERSHLNEEEIAAGFRLACSTHVLGDSIVEIPPASLTGDQRVLRFAEKQSTVPDPIVTEYELPESSPDVPFADWDTLSRKLNEVYGLVNLRPDTLVLPDLPLVLQTGGGQATMLVRDDRIIGVRLKGRELLGMAFDVGTTTVAGYLVNLRTGEEIAISSAANPQREHGEDVMSRISYVMEGGGDELRKSILKTLNHLIRDVVSNPEDIAEVTIVGNTAMHHIILGLPVKQLGAAPYSPFMYHSLDVRALELGLHIAPYAYVHFLPVIGGFVGADHVSMILATGMYKADKTILGVDIGTNTEVTLAAKGTLTSLSCASGPAFEGAGISRGMRATTGAIEKVRIDKGSVHLKVIGDVAPTGICGSGVLDVLSELRQWRIMDSRGRLQTHPLVRQGIRGREFILTPGNVTGTGQEIVITQRDIGEIQLAKAAIRTGIEILLGEACINANEVDEVIIAGAFGHYIDPKSGIGTGLFPPFPLKRFRKVGNAAGAGAKLALISKRERATSDAIAEQVRYVELSTHPGFSTTFSRALLFPDPIAPPH